MNTQTIEKVKAQLDDALAGVECYLANWPTFPQNFTTRVELQNFASKLREMRASVDSGRVVPIIGFWRIMETWPYNNKIRRKVVEAELLYERISSAVGWVEPAKPDKQPRKPNQ